MKLLKHKKGFSIGGLITFVIGALIAIVVIPIWITSYTESKGNFSSSEQSLLGIVSLLLVVGLIIGSLVVTGLKMKG